MIGVRQQWEHEPVERMLKRLNYCIKKSGYEEDLEKSSMIKGSKVYTTRKRRKDKKQKRGLKR